ncbi:hypothetical protein J41TS12_35220 [Paenibacillus antibioticophila]|uniref:Uncharacterized protein n=1 Tax=Paenibacillus antibioticophila TaxID=1274374 RepID=A0A919XSW1_9BACL|nr:hypothetical protein [Paenibacillus antibioticophila]GIO38661.1 hypothetical protein J41TS12_35220 [Paenibacillus antibioticophila]
MNWKKMILRMGTLFVMSILTAGCTFTSSQATLERQQSEPWWLVPALADEVYPQEVLKEVYPGAPIYP